MIIKESNSNSSHLNQFDLIGSDEMSLSKGFAYLMAKERTVLYSFLKKLGIKTSNTINNFRSTSIHVEMYRKQGRTDIEIRQAGKFHVIIESKISKNKVSVKQRKQYLSAFNHSRDKEKCLCFITGVNDFRIEVEDEVKIKNLSWVEIGNMLDSSNISNSQITRPKTSEL